MEGRLPAERPRRDREQRLLPALGWAYLVALAVFSWTLLSARYPLLIPSPSETLAFYPRAGLETVGRAVYRTLTNSVSGFALALAFSLASVMAAYLNRHAAALVSALNTFIQSVSVLVWSIVLIMVFGVSSRLPPVLVTAAACYPVLLSATLGGVQALDEKFSELARTLGASKLQEFVYFILPGTVPYVTSASRAAMGLALRISVVAEAFGASGGIGYQLVYSYDMGLREGVFAWGLLLIALMILLDYAVLRPVERWAQRWRL